MIYKVQTWDPQFNCTRYHEVADTIKEQDVDNYISHLFPNETILAIIYPKDHENLQADKWQTIW